MERVKTLEATLADVAAPFVKALGLRVVAADDQSATLSLPVTPALVHGGGVVCGQAECAEDRDREGFETVAGDGGQRYGGHGRRDDQLHAA